MDTLIVSLNEDNSAITMQASWALGQLQDKRAIEPLRQAYARWSTGQVQNESVKSFFVPREMTCIVFFQVGPSERLT